MARSKLKRQTCCVVVTSCSKSTTFSKPLEAIVVRMQVFLLVRRHKTSIFLSLYHQDTVLEVKKMLAGILKIQPKDQKLFNAANILLQDEKELNYYGISPTTTLPHMPMQLMLACRLENDEFEVIDVLPYSLAISYVKT